MYKKWITLISWFFQEKENSMVWTNNKNEWGQDNVKNAQLDQIALESDIDNQWKAAKDTN